MPIIFQPPGLLYGYITQYFPTIATDLSGTFNLGVFNLLVNNFLFNSNKKSLNNSLVLLCSNYKMAKKYAIFNKTADNLKKKGVKVKREIMKFAQRCKKISYRRKVFL